jgi:hypothetical protein
VQTEPLPPAASLADSSSAAAPAPGELQEAANGTAGLSSQECLDLQLDLGFSCQVSIDRLALTFQRGSTQPPTDEQLRDAVAALWAGSLPTERWAGCPERC